MPLLVTVFALTIMLFCIYSICYNASVVNILYGSITSDLEEIYCRMLKVAAILNFVERYSFHACTVLAHIMILYSGQCTPALAIKCALATFCLE